MVSGNWIRLRRIDWDARRQASRPVNRAVLGHDRRHERHGLWISTDHVLPSHIVGVLSLLVLAAAILARYPMRMAGRWRSVYVVGALIALYFNVFVLIVQSFLKVAALKALAPTQSEPSFVITQSVALIFFATATILAVRRFRDGQVVPAGGVFVRASRDDPRVPST